MLKIIILVLFNIALIVAQVLITSGRAWKHGLYIPIFNTLFAFGTAVFAAPFSRTITRIIEGQEITSKLVNPGGFLESFFGILFLLMIPAIINFILYFVARGKFKSEEISDINKMKINDLS